LHLENAMIKEYKPRYNVLLKDDKSYPFIVVTKEAFPRVFMTRDRDIPGKYYGPYANQQAAKTVLNLIREIYPVRSCRHPLDAASIARREISSMSRLPYKKVWWSMLWSKCLRRNTANISLKLGKY